MYLTYHMTLRTPLPPIVIVTSTGYITDSRLLYVTSMLLHNYSHIRHVTWFIHAFLCINDIRNRKIFFSSSPRTGFHSASLYNLFGHVNKCIDVCHWWLLALLAQWMAFACLKYWYFLLIWIDVLPLRNVFYFVTWFKKNKVTTGEDCKRLSLAGTISYC